MLNQFWLDSREPQQHVHGVQMKTKLQQEVHKNMSQFVILNNNKIGGCQNKLNRVNLQFFHWHGIQATNFWHLLDVTRELQLVQHCWKMQEIKNKKLQRTLEHLNKKKKVNKSTQINQSVDGHNVVYFHHQEADQQLAIEIQQSKQSISKIQQMENLKKNHILLD